MSAQTEAQGGLQSRLRRQEAVAELALFALQGTEMNGLFDRALEMAAKTLQVEYASILELKAGTLAWGTGWGWAQGHPEPIDQAQSEFTLLVQQPVSSEDMRLEQRFRTWAGVRSGLSVVVDGGQVAFGVLGVYSSGPRQFSEDEVGFLQSLAQVLRSALMRAQNERLMEFEAEVFRALSLHTELAPMLAACVQCMVSLPGATLAQVWLLEGAGRGLEIRASAGSGEPPEASRPRVERIAQTGLAELSTSLLEEGFAGHPLIVEGQVEGVLTMFSRAPLNQAVAGVLATLAIGMAQAQARLRDQTALAESRAQLSRVLEGSDDGAWDWHVPTGRVNYDRRWAGMLGYSVEELPKTLDGWLGLTHPEDLKHSFELMQRYWTGLAPAYERENRMRTRSGEWKWVLARGKVASWVAPGQPEWMTGTHVDIDQRKRAEEALAQSEQRLQLLVQQSPLAVIEWSPEGEVTAWNPAAQGIFGYSREQALGSSWTLLVAADFVEDAGAIWRVALSEPHHHSINDNKTRSGTVITCEWFNTPLVAADGGLIGMVSLCRDITESRRIDQELRTLWHAVGQSPLSVIITDSLGAIEFVNPRFVEMTGCALEEAIGKQVDMLLESGDIQQLWETLNSGETWRGEVGERRQNGELYWEWAVIAPVRDAQGTITNFIAFKEDITSRKLMERRLAESAASFKHIFDTMQDGYVSATLAGLIRLANPAAMTLLGYKDVPELLAAPLAELFVDEQERESLTRAVLERGQLLGQRATGRLKDGSLRTFEGNLRLLRDSNDRPESVEVMFRDVTERIQADADRQARLAADEANRLKSQFLAHMSHEIRTPLNAILGMAYLALTTNLSELQRDYIQHIQRAGQALLSIVNDILDFSKVEAGKLELERADLRVDDVLKNLVSLVGTTASEKGLLLRVTVTPEVPRQLLGDPLRLGQILLNLVGNAIKFTPSGEVSLTVSRPQAPLGEVVQLLFTVRDTGVGMTETQMKGLFSSFSQADSSITRKYGGTGLGLAICQRLVTLMQGEIAAESVPDKGSTFRFTAMFQSLRSDTASLPAAEVPPESLEDIRGARVLLVEDNLVNQRIARELLESVGFEVDVASHGRQALERILASGESRHWQAILMDLQMPEMDGYAATTAIRQDERFRKLPILAMTAHVLAEERERCYQVGMNDYISKPLDPAIMFATLRRWIRPLEAVRPEIELLTLKSLLENGDGAALDSWLKLRSRLVPWAEPAQLERISRQVDQFDFESALAELADIARIGANGKEPRHE